MLHGVMRLINHKCQILTTQQTNYNRIPSIPILGPFCMCRRKRRIRWRRFDAFLLCMRQVYWRDRSTSSINGLCKHAKWTACIIFIFIQTLHRQAQTLQFCIAWNIQQNYPSHKSFTYLSLTVCYAWDPDIMTGKFPPEMPPTSDNSLQLTLQLVSIYGEN